MSPLKLIGILIATLLLGMPAPNAFAQAPVDQRLDVTSAARFAALALDCVHREYPNKIAHVLEADGDAQTPRQLHPAFHGCYDWHSSVHGHWLLARLARAHPQAEFASAARAALARSLTRENLAAEAAYLSRQARVSFERPYGLAWLLQLAAELRTWDDPQVREWSNALVPLETLAATRIRSWVPQLHYPIRIGEHDQTAFAFGLIWDWAVVVNDQPMQDLLREAAQRFHASEHDCPIDFEPSGHDFLSPCLAVADFMRRVLDRQSFSRWLSSALPDIPRRPDRRWLPPGIVTNRSDPKLAHIDGLNLSRAWMLEGIAHSLGPRDRRAAALEAAAGWHREAALPQVTGAHYEGGHWLGTFAVYLVSRAGIASGR
jgi:hypothetical protein